MDVDYKGLKVGDTVRIVSEPRFQGNPRKSTPNSDDVGGIGWITGLGKDFAGKWENDEDRFGHVVINMIEYKPRAGQWIQLDNVELVDAAQELEDVLMSINEAAKHQEHVLIFKTIILADVTGKELRVTVEGSTSKKVVLYDENDMALATFDLDNWTNLQEAMSLAFRQIDPLNVPAHAGKEK